MRVIALAFVGLFTPMAAAASVMLDVAASETAANLFDACENKRQVLLEQFRIDNQIGEDEADQALLSDYDNETWNMPLPALCEVDAQLPDGVIELSAHPDEFSLNDLDAYINYAAFYQALEPNAHLSRENLAAVLEQMRADDPDNVSWWDALFDGIKSWWRSLFPDSEFEPPAWLRDLRLPNSVAATLLNVIIAALIIGAVVIVVIEVRQARRDRREYTEAQWQPEDEHRSFEVRLADIRQAPEHIKPSLYLQYLTQWLRTGKYLPAKPGLTAREISQQHTYTDPTRVVSTVAEAAERSTYGQRDISAEEMNTIHATLDELDNSGPDNA